MLLLTESQGRYKYALLPLFYILAAYGIYYGYDFFQKILVNKKTK